MTATGHALVGVILASKFQNPYIAIPLAMFSHIACDFLPHWDAGTNYSKKTKNQFLIEAFADVLLSFIITFLFVFFFSSTTPFPYALIVVFAAQWLDWIAVPFYVFWRNSPFEWIVKFSEATNTSLDKPWGILTQVAFVAFTFILTR